MTSLTASIDEDRAETAARRIVLAYEILDELSDHAEDDDALHSEAISVGLICMAIVCEGVGVPETEALLQFRSVYRLVRKIRKRLGKNATAAQVISEMHLDQRNERRRRK